MCWLEAEGLSHHSWGKVIAGLTRQKDGRWRIIGTVRPWTEPDEKRAVERYYDMIDARVRGTVGGVEIEAKVTELDAIIQRNELAFWNKVPESHALNGFGSPRCLTR